MSQEVFVTYEQAVKLKELGFDWECNHWYHPLELGKIIDCQTYCNHNSFERPYSAPTLAQAQKWLRDKHNLFVHVYLHLDDCWRYEIQCIFNHENYMYEPDAGLWWRSYEQTLSAGIDKALELLKQQSNGNQD